MRPRLRRVDAVIRPAKKSWFCAPTRLGGGALIDLAPYGIEGEPRVQESVRAGADLVIFSGDKLMGGPQAGIIAGRRELVETLGRHPLARALRLDKLSVAALAATFRLYRTPSDPVVSVPVLRMLTQDIGTVAARAEALRTLLADLKSLDCTLVEALGYAGGGALPMHALPSRALGLTSAVMSAEELARRLRTGPTAVVGRIERDCLLLDLRTVADHEVTALAVAVRDALTLESRS